MNVGNLTFQDFFIYKEIINCGTPSVPTTTIAPITTTITPTTTTAVPTTTTTATPTTTTAVPTTTTATPTTTTTCTPTTTTATPTTTTTATPTTTTTATPTTTTTAMPTTTTTATPTTTTTATPTTTTTATPTTTTTATPTTTTVPVTTTTAATTVAPTTQLCTKGNMIKWEFDLTFFTPYTTGTPENIIVDGVNGQQQFDIVGPINPYTGSGIWVVYSDSLSSLPEPSKPLTKNPTSIRLTKASGSTLIAVSTYSWGNLQCVNTSTTTTAATTTTTATPTTTTTTPTKTIYDILDEIHTNDRGRGALSTDDFPKLFLKWRAPGTSSNTGVCSSGEAHCIGFLPIKRDPWLTIGKIQNSLLPLHSVKIANFDRDFKWRYGLFKQGYAGYNFPSNGYLLILCANNWDTIMDFGSGSGFNPDSNGHVNMETYLSGNPTNGTFSLHIQRENAVDKTADMDLIKPAIVRSGTEPILSETSAWFPSQQESDYTYMFFNIIRPTTLAPTTIPPTTVAPATSAPTTTVN